MQGRIQDFFPGGGQVGQSARETPEAFRMKVRRGGGLGGLTQENLESEVL